MTSEQGDDVFQSKLDEKGKIKAAEELCERNEKDRKLAVQAFRLWIKQQDHWLKTPTDFAFLLRFLRVRKFSQLGARQTLENYWENKSVRPKWHTDIDPADPPLQEILRAKTYYSPKKYDKDGCRWIFSPFGNQTVEDINRWGLTNVYRAMVLFSEWVSFDENVQVNGVKWFIDFTGLSMAVAIKKYSNPEDQRLISQLFQRSMPIRMKAFYLFNEPSFFDIVYKTVSALTRPKLMGRIHMVGKSLVRVYETIDMSVLPDEYLPDDYTGPSAGLESDIVEDMLADMMAPAFRSYIQEVTSSKYGADLTKRTKNDEDTVASFRKLACE